MHDQISENRRRAYDIADAFLLICSPKPNDRDNLRNSGAVVLFNVSRKDGTRIFQLSGGVTDAVIEKNVVHVEKAGCSNGCDDRELGFCSC
jgi:hypothetical protein